MIIDYVLVYVTILFRQQPIYRAVSVYWNVKIHEDHVCHRRWETILKCIYTSHMSRCQKQSIHCVS